MEIERMPGNQTTILLGKRSSQAVSLPSTSTREIATLSVLALVALVVALAGLVTDPLLPMVGTIDLPQNTP